MILRQADPNTALFHTLVLGGTYDADQDLRFRPLPPPDDEEVARIAASVARGIARLLERRGLTSDAAVRNSFPPDPSGRPMVETT